MSWLATRYEALIKRLEQRLHVPWVLSAGCCSHEIENTGQSTYDWQRLGVDDLAVDPSQANLLVIAGWINVVRAEQIKSVYQSLRKPTSVIAFGTCALSGSPYVPGAESPGYKREWFLAEDLVPVDIRVPGCPPPPEALLLAILELQKKLRPGPTQRQILVTALKEREP